MRCGSLSRSCSAALTAGLAATRPTAAPWHGTRVYVNLYCRTHGTRVYVNLDHRTLYVNVYCRPDPSDQGVRESSLPDPTGPRHQGVREFLLIKHMNTLQGGAT